MSSGRRLTWKNVRVIGGGLLVGLFVSWVLWQFQSFEEQIHGLSTALTAQCNQTKRLGHKCVAAPAASVRANPAQPTVSPQPGPSGPQGPGPTADEVYSAVVAAIRAHPDWLHVQPDPATLLAAVDNWLAQHAPAAIPPTTQQVYTAVLAVYTAHPPSPGAAGSTGPVGPSGPAGQKGDKGDPGDPPSAEQIAQAVSDWMQQHPLPVCPDGTSAQAHTWLTLDAGTISAVVCEKTSTG